MPHNLDRIKVTGITVHYSDVIKYHSGALAGQFGPMQYTVLSSAMHKDTFFMKFHLLNILLLCNNSAKLALKGVGNIY